MKKLIVPVLAFFLVAGVASASEGKVEINSRWGGPAFVPAGSVSADGDAHDEGMPHPGMWHGSTTPDMHHGSSTPEMHGMPPKMMGIPGIIASIGTNSFVMTVPRGKDHATTTLTVNVSSSTVYSNASTTASFSDLSAGTHVVVLGTVSTSTKSVTAKRIILNGDFHRKPDMKKGLGGFLSHLKDLFGKHASSTEHMHASSTSAAAIESDFLSTLFHKLFGWL